MALRPAAKVPISTMVGSLLQDVDIVNLTPGSVRNVLALIRCPNGIEGRTKRPPRIVQKKMSAENLGLGLKPGENSRHSALARRLRYLPVALSPAKAEAPPAVIDGAVGIADVLRALQLM